MAKKDLYELLAVGTIELKKLILNETPIEDITRIGDFSKRQSIIDPVDRKLLSSPKAEVKFRKIWQNTPGKYNLVFVNDPRVKGEDFREVGMVSEDYVRNVMKISRDELPIDPTACTVIFTNNKGDERVMSSGWILAHRLGHAIQRKNNKVWANYSDHLTNLFKNMLSDVYGIQVSSGAKTTQPEEAMMKLVAQQLGTMKSARDSNLRNWNEFAYEVFAQYLLTGNVRFNPLPDELVTKLGAFGRSQKTKVFDPDTQETYNRHDLEYYSGLLQAEIDSVIESLPGKIFVM